MNKESSFAIILIGILVVSTFMMLRPNSANADATVDSYEPDNDYTQAHVLRMRETQTHSIYPSGDNDWLELRIDYYSNAVICAYGTFVSISMSLYYVNLTQIASNVTGHGGADGFCKISVLLQPTIYYIQIAAADNVSTIPEYYVNATYATAFQTKLGNGSGRSVQLTPDGGYIFAGLATSNSGNTADVYLVKTDASGNMQWSKTYGGSGWDEGDSVAVTPDGGYVIAGLTESYGNVYGDVYLVKTDASGNMQWSKTYGGSGNNFGYSVAVTPDGGYVIAGWTTSYGPGFNGHVYLVKTDASGNMQWQKWYGGSGWDEGNSVAVTPDGGYVIAGLTTSYGSGGCDVYLVKTDASGNMQWSKTYGGANDDVGYSVQQTSDGGYVIAGETMSYGSGGWNVYLVKTDASGNMQWQKWYGGSGNCGYSVVVASDGGYVIAAQNGLIKTDMSGNSPPYSDVILYEGTALIPVVVYTVLHDPPGSDSFTWLSNTVTTSCETTLSAGSKSTVQVEAKADFLGNGVDASQSVSVTPSTTSSDALVVSSTQALSSSNIFDDPWYIGPGYGDVVAGEAWLLHYRVVDRTYPNGTTATVLDYGETREASHVLAAQFFVTTTWIRNHVQEPWRSKLLAMDIGRDNFIHDEDQGNVVDYGPYLLSGGIPIDNSSKVTGRSTKSSTFDIEVSSEVAATCGFEVEGIGGASGTVKVGLSFSTGITQETATEREKEIGYHLYDHKGNDTLSMELYYDKVFGTYMFLTSPGTWTSDPQEYTPIQHRVGVTNANCAKTVVCQSFGANMSVSVDNSGANDENVNVTVYAGSTPLVSQIVPMPSQSCTDLVFNLDTAGLAKANYTLSACAWVPDQNDTLDNNFTGGWIIVSMVGDLTGGSANVWDFVPDGKCDGKDISVVAKCFGSYPGCSPPLIWNANCDVNNDGKVDGKDIATVARHLGE